MKEVVCRKEGKRRVGKRLDYDVVSGSVDLLVGLPFLLFQMHS